MEKWEIENFLNSIINDKNYHEQIQERIDFKRSLQKFCEFPQKINEKIIKKLSEIGITKLYSHQKEVFSLVSSEKNVILISPTASGKTLAFYLPILNSLLEDEQRTALLLYPTKSLIEDQRKKFREIDIIKEKYISIFDGDTPQEERRAIREFSTVILSNPDIIHFAMLPYHSNWGRFLRNLKFVIIDEAHYYTGVLGSHISNLIRRLRRVLAFYNAYPVFILLSATISNPLEFAQELVGEKFSLVENKTGFRGSKTFLVFNPPVVNKEKNIKKSAIKESFWIFSKAIAKGIRTIDFTKSRKEAELIYKYIKNTKKDISHLVSTYRAGYLKEERRKIEKALAERELLGVVSTTALELGIDIGDLDVSIITGYPGSLISLFQQMGRAGRDESHSLTFFIPSANPLDQYIANNKDYMLKHSFESSTINPLNNYILYQHLECAAKELPLKIEDKEYFYDDLEKDLKKLEKEEILKFSQDKYYAIHDYPHKNINLRSLSQAQYLIIRHEDKKIIEKAETYRVMEELYEGAIYFHMGDTYKVAEVDHINKRVYIKKEDSPYYTQPLIRSNATIKNVLKEKSINGLKIYFGDLKVTELVVGYIKKHFQTEVELQRETLAMPEISYETKGLWLNVPQKLIKELQREKVDVLGSLHGVEHIMVAMMPGIVLCDRKDLGGISTIFHKDTQEATIFIYDGHIGGVGLTEKGFDEIETLLTISQEQVENCKCKDGCPSCIYSPKCGNNNTPLDKNGSNLLLLKLLDYLRE